MQTDAIGGNLSGMTVPIRFLAAGWKRKSARLRFPVFFAIRFLKKLTERLAARKLESPGCRSAD